MARSLDGERLHWQRSYLGIYKFFRRLLTADDNLRRAALKDILTDIKELSETNQEELHNYVPTINRLALEAPFEDIRKAFCELSSRLAKEFGLTFEAKQSPSLFIPYDRVVPVDATDSELREIFITSFCLRGRVSHLERVLAFHPPYLKIFRKVSNSLMFHDGPLPLSWRCYIAIMAASRYHCGYIVALEEQYFIMNGGESTWLKGLQFAPLKLQKLARINAVLAHRPWLMDVNLVRDLLGGEDAWSLTELVHALVILAHIHALSCFVWGLGVTPEVDLQFPFDSVGEPESDSDPEDIALIERDETALYSRLITATTSLAKCVQENMDDTHEPFEVSDVKSAALRIKSSQPKADVAKFRGSIELEHTDFDVRSESYRIFHTEDFSWEDQGFATLNRFLPEAASVLDELFQFVQVLTYCRYKNSEEEIDTTPFRRAIWMYVLRIMGICNDDYDYHEVNVFLNRPTKAFVKKTACVPYRIKKNDFDHFDHTFTVEEKCHVGLLLMEARKQASLLYALSAIGKYLR